MPLSEILETYASSPGVRNVSDRAWKNGRTLSVTGLAGSARSLTVAHAHRLGTGPTLAVVDTTEAAEQLRDDLLGLLGEESTFLFPDWELLPYEHLSPDSEVTGARIQALDALVRAKSPIIVSPIRGLMRKTLPKSTLAASTLYIKTGDLIEFQPLLDTCASLGFERSETVQASGQFGVRGGIVDIFPFGTPRPYRVEMFGDEVESVRLFDPYTQRSTDEVPGLSILPSREIVLNRDTIEESALRVMEAAAPHDIDCRETVEQIQEHGYFDGAERYLSYYHPDADGLLSYFGDEALICLCEPSQLKEHANAFLKEIEESYSATIEGGDIVPAPLEQFEDFDPWADELAKHRLAYLSRSAIDMTDEIDLNTSNSGAFHGAMDVLRKRLSEWRGQNARISIVCDNKGQADRLSEMLGAAADGISMPVGTLQAGFVLPDIPAVILTDAEIFSRYQRRRRRSSFKEGVVIEDFTSLVDRDFVVHIDHGIGKYMGLQRLTVDERERDCLNIGYAEGDKLYIPSEQLHRVQKYVGADGEVPALSRLGGKAWEQAKARTRKAVQDIAQDLVKLYAARQSNPGYIYATDTPWQREMEEAFIYDETPDQLAAVEDIKKDMQREMPMDRLVCGDVGYGKTEVAIRAAFKAVQDGKQVAVLVPTTILAQQHLTTFSERLADYPVSVGMLSRFVSTKDQRKVIGGLQNGEVDISDLSRFDRSVIVIGAPADLVGILHPGTFSMLGVGVSFAISAKLANPGGNVLLISGDGAFLSGGLSVEAAFQEKAPITVVIDNNGGLDCIAQQQERIFHSGQRFATDFRDIPFHSMFEGLGGHGELVESRDQLKPALERALASGKTACVNVKTKGVISPIVAAASDRRDKASIE